jgi:hypothetical protein
MNPCSPKLYNLLWKKDAVSSGTRSGARLHPLFLCTLLTLVLLNCLPQSCSALDLCTYVCGTTENAHIVSDCSTECTVETLCGGRGFGLAVCENAAGSTAGISVRAEQARETGAPSSGCASHLLAYINATALVPTVKLCPGTCCDLDIPIVSENFQFHSVSFNITATNAILAFLPRNCSRGQTFAFFIPTVSNVSINGVASTTALMSVTGTDPEQVCIYGL